MKILLALLLLQQSTGKLEDALKLASADEIKKTVTTLASDEYEGRSAGYPGNDKAAEWIAARLKDLGLKPAGENGTWFQTFDFTKRNDNGPRDQGGKAKTRNVVGVIPGSDPKLKNEYVVVGAHYDHVGTSDQADGGRMGRPTDDDRIWNGADDNGSGTAAILEVARILRGAELKPKRSILFVWFSAEEVGLTGSEWYCAHPIVPLEQTVAMINMDMVGKGVGKLDVSAMATSDAWPAIVDRAAKASGVTPKSLTDKYDPDSDHASFAAKRIPTIFFFTGLHADYHRPSDHADRLDYDGLAAIAKLSAAAVWDLANAKDRPLWQDPSSKKPDAPVPALGISGYEVPGSSLGKFGLPKDAAGVRVSKVDAGSNAEEAKLSPGDVVIGFAGKGFPSKDPVKTLRDLAAAQPKGKDVSIVVVRDGKKTTLKVKWKA